MLRVENLTFGYSGASGLIFEDLEFGFPDGAITAVTGPSGGGKSTLLYLLALMLTPWSGDVFHRGRPVSSLSDRQRSGIRAQEMGFVFQDASLDANRTVLDNVLEGCLYAGSRDVHRARDLLHFFSVDDRHEHRPGEVSGGQAQRVALCRALIKRPSVVLCDEPTGNLDQESAEVVWSALDEVRQEGACVVVATHDLRLAARADQQLVVA